MEPIITELTHCPDTAELRQLVEGSLSDQRQEACTQHLDSCETCRAKLDEIATDGSNLVRVVERLNETQPAINSPYWAALRALDSDIQPTLIPGSPSRHVSLSFLEPAADAAYLGRLAHFDVMRVLGRGGMGVVLEAFDSRLHRHVAIKVLDPELADDETARQRFCRESRAAASITHENVVAVHHVEKSGDGRLPFLVMQLITGESLEQRLARDKRPALREIVRIGMEAARGLAAAHAQGLIHRDVKPGNILLEAAGDRVKLTDFGLARVAEDVRLTRTGFVTGTPLYMAPEQGGGGDPDPRSDLFSLGAVLYEMCAGRPPFDGDSALAILKQIAEVPHRPIRELNPAIPEWLAETVERLLAKDPAERIQSAAQLAELFEFQWALLKTTSEDVPTLCRVKERKRKIRNLWIAAAVGATFLVLGLTAGWFLGDQDDPPAAGDDGAGEVSSAEPAAILSANAGAIWSTAFDPKGETLAMAAEDGSVRLWDLASQSVKATLSAHNGTVSASRFSPDGELLVTAGDDSLIKLWRPPGAKPFRIFEHPSAVRGIALAHDGSLIYAGGRDGALRVWRLDTSEPLAQARHPGSVFALALSPDGQTLASAGTDKVVRLWNAETLAPKLPLEGHSGPIYGLAFHRDGRRLASVGWDGSVHIWDAGSGLAVRSWDGHEGDIWGVAYSPDGAMLATGGHNGAVKLWNPETGELLQTFISHKLAIRTVAFSQDGTRLASGSRDGTARVWKVE